jgi:hypothetical protein
VKQNLGSDARTVAGAPKDAEAVRKLDDDIAKIRDALRTVRLALIPHQEIRSRTSPRYFDVISLSVRWFL